MEKGCGICPLMSSAPVQPAICTRNITGDGAYLPKGPNATRFGSVSEGVPRLRQGAVRPAGARVLRDDGAVASAVRGCRSEEHTSELPSLMRISYAVFCLKNKNKVQTQLITIKQ